MEARILVFYLNLGVQGFVLRMKFGFCSDVGFYSKGLGFGD